MAANAVAQFEQVSKVYRCGLLRRREVPAVRDLSLCVEAGEVFGLLGPNRAGKTTLIKLLLSLCRPTQGNVSRFGRPASERVTLARIGYLHEHHSFPRYWSAAGLLEYYAALAYVPAEQVRQRLPALLKRVDLTAFRDVPIARFSKGMLQRLALAQALINEPDLLVLDEPSEGLDLAGRRLIREVIAEQRNQGKSVVMVSHLLGEVEKVCDRIGVMVEGRLVHTGTVASFTRTSSGNSRPIEQALQELYRGQAHA